MEEWKPSSDRRIWSKILLGLAGVLAWASLVDLIYGGPFHLGLPVLAAACWWGSKRAVRPPPEVGVTSKFRARVELISSDEGGKLASLSPGDRLRLRGAGSDEDIVLELARGAGDPLNPGSSGDYVLWSRSTTDVEGLETGAVLDLWEAGRSVGQVEILAKAQPETWI